MYITHLLASPVRGKKYRVIFDDGTFTDFGAQGMSDYTIHHDRTRKERYMKRHKKDLETRDIHRAGYLSWYLLWGFPSLSKSVTAYNKWIVGHTTIPLDLELWLSTDKASYERKMIQLGLPAYVKVN